MAILLILSIIIIGFIVKRKSKKHTLASIGDASINMYSLPAYGTHQEFSESEIDHLYESVHKEKGVTVTLQETTIITADAKETDVDGYFKMNSFFCKSDAITEETVSDTKRNMGRNNDISDEEYVQAADDKDHLPTDTKDEDDGYEYENECHTPDLEDDIIYELQ